VRPFKLTVCFIVPTLYCISSSMTPMVTAPEDNRNFLILKPLLDEVVYELGMCPLRKLIPRTGVELHVTYPQGPDRFLSSVVMTLSLQLQKKSETVRRDPCRSGGSHKPHTSFQPSCCVLITWLHEDLSQSILMRPSGDPHGSQRGLQCRIQPSIVWSLQSTPTVNINTSLKY
jgi:hypothetical protein